MHETNLALLINRLAHLHISSDVCEEQGLALDVLRVDAGNGTGLLVKLMLST